MEGVQLRPLLGHHPCFAGVPSGQFPADKFMSSVMVSGQLNKKTCFNFFYLFNGLKKKTLCFTVFLAVINFCSQGQ